MNRILQQTDRLCIQNYYEGEFVCCDNLKTHNCSTIDGYMKSDIIMFVRVYSSYRKSQRSTSSCQSDIYLIYPNGPEPARFHIGVYSEVACGTTILVSLSWGGVYGPRQSFYISILI